MTYIQELIHSRELKRKRYVPYYGWVVSNTAFYARIQPKWTDSLNRTEEITLEELFLNTGLFRDADNNVSTFLNTTTYTFPTTADALLNSQSGIDVVPGDRIIEEESGRVWIVRSISEYRDNDLWHDELICVEASQLDRKWIEPVTILTLSDQASATEYDGIFKQYNKFYQANYTETAAFGCVAVYDAERYTRDKVQLQRQSARGKMITEPIVLHIDADFPVDNKSLIVLRGITYKIEFIRESFFRVYSVGLQPYTQEGANTTLTNRPHLLRNV